ncbi:hypothetical protein [Sphingomonas sp. URHD0057]|uniref:hypothetical protein n=1 Tax=Sphingomonas sp. URHD0057 TaxID=1380389 RepID=UPI0018CBF9A8|nr:hypothetical protein [Sphingomonas sp. URHD0057]
MPAGLPVALALLAAGVAYGPTPPVPPKQAAKAAPKDGCQTPQASERDIVICAQRPGGYRLDPDIMQAHREARQARAGRLKTPRERMDGTGCGMDCRPSSPDLLAMAIGAATMAKRLADGKEVGSMFITRPEPDEYHRYLAAKQQREAREAAAKTAAIVAAAKAGQAASANAAAPAAKP